MEKLTVYTNKTCFHCTEMTERLKKENIKFKEKVIEEYKNDWQKVVGLTAIPTTPTIEYQGQYFVPGRDYQNVNQLIDILKEFEVSIFDNSKIILERIKSLNYTLAIAFQKLDKSIKQIETKINTNEHKSTD